METLWRAESGVLLRMPKQTAYPARILNNTQINRHVSPLWWQFRQKYEGVHNLKNKDIVMTRQQLDPAGRKGKKPTKPRLFWLPMYSVYIRRVPTRTTQNDRSIVKINEGWIYEFTTKITTLPPTSHRNSPDFSESINVLGRIYRKWVGGVALRVTGGTDEGANSSKSISAFSWWGKKGSRPFQRGGGGCWANH